MTLLLSDGANSAGGDPFVQAERARQLRVPVYTIALGTAGGVLRQPNAFGGTRIQPVPPDPDSLARIAETSNGRFFEAPSSENLTAVYDSLGSRIGFRMEEREVTVAFTAAGLLLLAAAGALRARRGARLPDPPATNALAQGALMTENDQRRLSVADHPTRRPPSRRRCLRSSG